MNHPLRIAFALGGLAGHNAHGAGFLHAALTRGIDPDVISCTSGQIYWVYQYLFCRHGRQETLREHLQKGIEATFGSPAGSSTTPSRT